MKTARRCFLAAMALATMAGGQALAGTVIYTNQAAFDAALAAGSYTETFDGLPFPSQSLGSSLPFSGGGFSFTASSSNGLFSAGNSAADVWLTNNFNTDPLNFAFTGGSPTAVGGYFFITDFAGNSVANATNTLTVMTNDGTTYVVPANSTPTSNFVGFISDAPITSLSVSTPGGNSQWATVNNLTVGTAAVANSVPEPSTFALAGLAGIGGLMALVRRRKAADA